eukprot:Partr_v1_DN25691_c0_g1_i2_m4500 putative Abhydrolase domain containing
MPHELTGQTTSSQANLAQSLDNFERKEVNAQPPSPPAAADSSDPEPPSFIYNMLTFIPRTTVSMYRSICQTSGDALMQRALLAEHRLFTRLSFYDGSHVGSSLANPSNDIKVDDENSKPIVQGTAGNSKAYARIQQVDIGDGRFINTFIMDTDGQQDFSKPAKRTLVLGHGFGAGLGMWFKNIEGLSLIPGLRVYAIDWLGMGRSSRTPLPVRQSVHSDEEDLAVVEAYFVDSLEAWRTTLQIEQMTLLGHSLGGYFSCRYALQYPERVKQLILASPAGVPEEAPFASRMAELTFPQRQMLGLFHWGWESGYTPQGFIRSFGSFGRTALRKYATNRFPTVTGEDSEAMYDYMLAITSLEGTGEYALHRILRPGAWARNPLKPYLPKLQMPSYYMYGDHDWMDPRPAAELLMQ